MLETSFEKSLKILVSIMYRSLKYPLSYLLSKDIMSVNFITGISGSGTSLLGSLIYQNLEIDYFSDETANRISPKSSYFIRPIDTFPDLRSYINFCNFPIENIHLVRKELITWYAIHAYPILIRNVIDKTAMVGLTRVQTLKKMFPSAKFLLIYRNPESNIEGLIRKWSLFRNSKLDEVCFFWRDMHMKFIANIQEFKNDVLFISYEDLINDHYEVIEIIKNFLSLKKRRDKRKLYDKDNKQGKGLRDVVDGLINIRKDANVQSFVRLKDNEIEMIKKITEEAYVYLERVMHFKR
jgi:hypothetical protein